VIGRLALTDGAPALEIWPAKNGYRVVFATEDRFELLGEFVTLREAGDARRDALGLAEALDAYGRGERA
jgi:hypothetical protein